MRHSGARSLVKVNKLLSKYIDDFLTRLEKTISGENRLFPGCPTAFLGVLTIEIVLCAVLANLLVFANKINSVHTGSKLTSKPNQNLKLKSLIRYLHIPIILCVFGG